MSKNLKYVLIKVIFGMFVGIATFAASSSSHSARISSDSEEIKTGINFIGVKGRVGPVLNIVAVNGSKITYRILNVGLLVSLNKGSDQDWLFASPLSVLSGNRDISPGANALDLGIFGASEVKPYSDEVKRNFIGMYRMANARCMEYLSTAGKDADDAKIIIDSVKSYLREIVNLRRQDTLEELNKFQAADNIIKSRIRIRVMLVNGETLDFFIKLSTTDLAYWLGSYVHDDDVDQMLSELKN